MSASTYSTAATSTSGSAKSSTRCARRCGASRASASRRAPRRSTAATNSPATCGRSSARAGLLGITVPERWGGAEPRLPGAHHRHGGDLPRLGLGGSVLRRAFQPVHEPDRAERQRRAARPLPAEAGLGRTRGRARHERARRRFGRGRHAAARGEARRRLRRSPAARCGSPTAPTPTSLVVYAKTDPAAGPRGITAFIVEKGTAGFLHRAEARQARHARLLHLRAGVRELPGARRKRARASSMAACAC